ncbi:hypothetical protein AWC25_01590 [Mycobacterium sherrisii]|uniref:Acyl-CoA dehydrogenase/oxidase N-terminal domain-containing protein n=1 Tax=Mycobacterium sherrisii TaxID=243061 RepID=A0A1E3SVA8_9MYCO|nr:hypothetical protein BHQ21_14035 [Mycobacterium sherrisii]ORW82624.1 hypothetical protein AWC25_01590 [Mycobacterium sherrisii]
MSTPDLAVDLDARIQALLDSHDPATTDPPEFLGAQYDAGLARVDLSEGFGGLGLPRQAQQAVNARLSSAGAPVGGTPQNLIGMGMAAPTIAAFGTDEQKRKFLRPLFTGEQVYRQLFSEPGTGSDLAGLTYVLCDMPQPGVDVRPPRQITGEADFNEVFRTDVRVPDANRLGPVGGIIGELVDRPAS